MSLPEIPAEPPRREVVYVHHYSAPMRHGWLRFVIKDLETNPQSQFAVHKYGAFYWLLNFPLITCLYIFEPHLWLALGIFITLIYSIYANFATDYGAMSAALAAMNTPDTASQSELAANTALTRQVKGLATQIRDDQGSGESGERIHKEGS